MEILIISNITTALFSPKAGSKQKLSGCFRRAIALCFLLSISATHTYAQSCMQQGSGFFYEVVGGPLTDGESLGLLEFRRVGTAPVLNGSSFILSGYKYNEMQPTLSNPNGVGKELIHRSCHSIGSPINSGQSQFRLQIGDELPSGEYYVGIVSECPADIETAAVCENDHKFLVTPSYMVSSIDQIVVTDDSESTRDRPAEIVFQFASFSGRPFFEDQAHSTNVSFRGVYPGAHLEASILTAHDDSTFNPDLPIFVGRQSDMYFAECIEESRSLRSSIENSAAELCNSRRTKDRYSNSFKIGLSGMELDNSSPGLAGKLLGATATGLVCTLAFTVENAGGLPTCVGAGLSLGKSINSVVDELVSDDDDNLGSLDRDYDLLSNFVWESTGSTGDGPIALMPSQSGNISATIKNREVGGLRVQKYQFSVEDIQILEGYDFFSLCRPPSETFATARMILLTDGLEVLPNSKRIPGGTGVVTFPGGNFPTPFEVDSNSFSANEAPESPMIYVEISIWESDGRDRGPDLIGMFSESFAVIDLVKGPIEIRNLFENYSRSPGTFRGHPVSDISATRSVEVKGFQGGDSHCVNSSFNNFSDIIIAQNLDPRHQGKARIRYKIDFTWLQHVLH